MLLSGWGKSEVERHHPKVNQGHIVTELKSDQPFPFSLLSLIKHMCVYTALDSKYDVSSTNVIIEHIHCNIVVRQCSCNNGADFCSCTHTHGHIHASTYFPNVARSKETDSAHIASCKDPVKTWAFTLSLSSLHSKKRDDSTWVAVLLRLIKILYGKSSALSLAQSSFLINVS